MLWRLIDATKSRGWLLPLGLLVLGLVGCGSTGPTGKVTGRVTLKGVAVSEGTNVMFVGGPEPSSAKTGADGKFALPKPIKVGDYVVVISAHAKEMDPAEAMKATKAGGGSGLSTDSAIPAKYTLEATSDAKFEIKTGDNVFTLDMIDTAGAAE